MNIVVLLPFEQNYRDRLAAVAPDAVASYYDSAADCPDGVLREAEVVFGNPPVRLLPEMKKLRWVQLRMAGTEPYSLPGVLPEGVLLTNATGAFGHAISEHLVASTLMLVKNLHLYRDNQRSGAWLDRGPVRSVSSLTVLVLGMGDIGGQYAARMKALGAYVIGVRRADATKPDWADEVHLTADLDGLLPRADVVALALPDTPQTRGILDRRRIGLLKPGAYVLNVGRGSAIDTEALCDAAESGAIGGASLDVTDPEPLPPEHRAWRIERICITPHISGFFHMRETYDNMLTLMLGNLERYLSGKPLKSEVDRKTGYAKKN